jgi:hypothetical protein
LRLSGGNVLAGGAVPSFALKSEVRIKLYKSGIILNRESKEEKKKQNKGATNLELPRPTT